MNVRQLWFTDPGKVEIREQQLESLLPDQVLVKNLYSAVSTGTELLVYRGQLPESLSLDESLADYSEEEIGYPLQYGYACVGEIEQVGDAVDTSLIGRRVFSFKSHASHNSCNLDEIEFVPDDIDPKAAVFLANMETAVNLVQDGNLRLGERAVVIGQGIVGLLTTSLIAQYPLAGLYTLESVAARQSFSEKAGADAVYSPASEHDLAQLKTELGMEDSRGGADVVFELSGSPEALNLAVDLCGYSGRIVIGSWYGSKSAEINLGERFHRNRMEIVSSQVSSIAPELTGRWDKARRFSIAWEMIRKCQPERFISHCMSFDSAAQAYELLDRSPEEALQVVFDYQS